MRTQAICLVRLKYRGAGTATSANSSSAVKLVSSTPAACVTSSHLYLRYRLCTPHGVDLAAGHRTIRQPEMVMAVAGSNHPARWWGVVRRLALRSTRVESAVMSSTSGLARCPQRSWFEDRATPGRAGRGPSAPGPPSRYFVTTTSRYSPGMTRASPRHWFWAPRNSTSAAWNAACRSASRAANALCVGP